MISNYLANKLIDHFCGTASYTEPTVYCTLFTTMPSPTGSGAVEAAITRLACSFNAAANQANTNSTDLVFTSLPAVTIVGYGLYDALTTGNLLWARRLEQALASTETLTLASGIGQLANGANGVSGVVVKNSAESTTYVEGTDYSIDYATGTISNNISGSGITASQTLHITAYNYPITRAVLAGDKFELPATKIGFAFAPYSSN